MSLGAGLEYADDHVTLQCVKVCIPAEQKQKSETKKAYMKKIKGTYSDW